MQTVWNGEHYMEVFHSRQYLLLAHLDPFLAFLVLALGAVAVTATVIAHVYLATLWTDLQGPLSGREPCGQMTS